MGRTRYVKNVGEVFIEADGSLSVDFAGKRISMLEAEKINKKIA